MTKTVRPQPGDRIMVFQEHWLNLILKKKKTMEIRGKAFKAGRYWLGYKGFIRGIALFGNVLPVLDDATWEGYRTQHLVPTEKPPYRKTWGLPILCVHSVSPVKYKHPRGAVGIVRYRTQ